jgi:hypothetical protein
MVVLGCHGSLQEGFKEGIFRVVKVFICLKPPGRKLRVSGEEMNG